MPIRAFLRHHWPTVTIAVTAAAIGCAAFVMLGNMPPHRIVMTTGPEGSAYEEDGKRYQAALAKAGVEVQLRSTAGSVETAALLRDPRSGVSVGLMQGGVVGVMQGGGAAANTAGLVWELSSHALLLAGCTLPVPNTRAHLERFE
jgi:TRAP-type uncharacterized transport system substrate-binding protein